MKTARLFGPKDIRIVDIPIPKVGDNDVLVKVKNVGICGTDYTIYTGESSFVKDSSISFPMTLGHEWSGLVEDVGKNVRKFKPGDRVTGDGSVSCGICYECLCGRYLYCENLRCVGTLKTWDGAYAEYILMPERCVYDIPDGVSYEDAALIEPVATALYSVERADIKMGEIVLVQGTGPIGLAAVQLAKLSGAACVILSGRKDFKLHIGQIMGADVTVNIMNEDLEERIMKITDGKGPHKIIEASGSIEALNQASKMIRAGGKISVVAFYDRELDKFDIDSFVLSDASLVSVIGSPRCSVKILELMKYKRVDFNAIITHRYMLDEVGTVLDNMKKNNEKKIKVMLTV